MATVAPTTHEYEQKAAQPVVDPNPGSANDSSVNGVTIQHNPPTAYPNPSPQTFDVPHTSTSSQPVSILASPPPSQSQDMDTLNHSVESTAQDATGLPAPISASESQKENAPPPDALSEEKPDVAMADADASEAPADPVVNDSAQSSAPAITTEQDPVRLPDMQESPDHKMDNSVDTIAPQTSTVSDDPPRPTPKVARDRDEESDAGEPSAKRMRSDAGQETSSPVIPKPQTPAPETQDSSQSTAPAPATTNAIAAAPGSSPNMPPPSSAETKITTLEPEKDYGPMTDLQLRIIKQNLVNLKKGRHAAMFSKPVDVVALNIPTYLDVVKQPMDLSTLEQNLKDGKYASVPDFLKDFNLIISNSHAFNGPTHAVSISANNLKAQFEAGMRRVPGVGQDVPAPPKKRAGSFALPSRDTKVRAARASLGNAPAALAAASAGASETFALSNNGIPTVRRTSTTDGRPKREIKPAPPRDMPYSAKPKKKKYQMELKFCEHVLAELKKGRYSTLMVPFEQPVDPVALNIPNYHKVIKKPMDFGTVTKNLNAGEYENLKEFESDVRLIFENCIKFNGAPHPISVIAKQLEDIFNAEMAHKAAWIGHNAPASAPQSPDLDSEVEEEDEAVDEEQDEVAAKAEALRTIQQQIAELSAQAMALTSAPVAKPAKAKKGTKGTKAAGGKPGKKAGGPGVAKHRASISAPKAKTKPPKPLTLAQKEEIAHRIGELDGAQTTKAAEFIKNGLRRIGRADLADLPDDELEFDIGIIPEDALQAIYKMIKSNEAPSSYSRSTTVSKIGPPPPKSKKNKPMSKHEQEAAIRQLERQARAFDGPARRDDSSGGNDDDDDDDDDDDESASESEEE